MRPARSGASLKRGRCGPRKVRIMTVKLLLVLGLFSAIAALSHAPARPANSDRR
jgi:hypothetical protein